MKGQIADKLNTEERCELKDEDFGIPETREFPMPDAPHVRAAEAYFRYAPEDKKEEWAVDFTDGSVAFGSAYHNWAINVPMMQKTGVNFKDIIDYCNDEKQKELAQKVPLSEVLLGMVVEHLDRKSVV